MSGGLAGPGSSSRLLLVDVVPVTTCTSRFSPSSLVLAKAFQNAAVLFEYPPQF